MMYGTHTADVQDLVEFILSGQLLRNPRLPRDASLKISRNLSEAQQYRELPPEAWEDGWAWKDILEYAGMCGSNFPSERLRRLEPELIDRLNNLYDDQIYPSLRRQLSGQCSEEVISDIWADFTYLIGVRAAFGRSLPFVERLIDLYRSGGYPCGWTGLYPEGQMVVYFPPEDESSQTRLSTGEGGADDAGRAPDQSDRTEKGLQCTV